MPKLYYIKFKTFLCIKGTVNRVKKKPTHETGENFANYISDWRLIHKYIRIPTTQQRKNKQPNLKMSKLN